MKITGISTWILRVPLGTQRFFSSQCSFPERNSLLVRIDTDEGISGWGEGGQYGPPEPVAVCIEEVLAPLILGREPQPTRIWEDLYSFSRDFGQKGTYVEAISAIDIALWDIMGKMTGQPVHRLLGGAFRDSVGTYATGCYYRGEDVLDYRAQLSPLADEAAGYVEQGFTMLKIKVGLLPVEVDLERVAAIRDRIGRGPKLMVDANHAYNVFTAVRLGRAMEPYDILWFEEPVVPEDREGYRRVRDSISIPVAGGEAEFTRYGFRDLFAAGCVDIAQPDIAVCGGLSEFRNILALASSAGIWTIPHVWGSGVALAAALQAIAIVPPFPHTANTVYLQNEPVVEFDRNHNPLRDDLLAERITLKDGRVPVPQGPGLGIEVRQDVLEQYCTRTVAKPGR